MVAKLKYVDPGWGGDWGEGEFKDQPRLINKKISKILHTSSNESVTTF